MGWSWIPTQLLHHPSSAGQVTKWTGKAHGLRYIEGDSFASYRHGQNRLDLEKSNLIYYHFQQIQLVRKKKAILKHWPAALVPRRTFPLPPLIFLPQVVQRLGILADVWRQDPNSTTEDTSCCPWPIQGDWAELPLGISVCHIHMVLHSFLGFLCLQRPKSLSFLCAWNDITACTGQGLLAW